MGFAETVSSPTSSRLDSTGHPLTLWPSAYNTNSNAVRPASIHILQTRETSDPNSLMQWDTIDYSIWAARNYGLRLIVPLTGMSYTLTSLTINA